MHGPVWSPYTLAGLLVARVGLTRLGSFCFVFDADKINRTEQTKHVLVACAQRPVYPPCSSSSPLLTALERRVSVHTLGDWRGSMLLPLGERDYYDDERQPTTHLAPSLTSRSLPNSRKQHRLDCTCNLGEHRQHDSQAAPDVYQRRARTTAAAGVLALETRDE